MAKKQKQPTKTCADCIHESACRIWTNGRFIADASASECPGHETVKGSAAYLCGVIDERNRKQTNADRIRAISDKELAVFLADEVPHGDCCDCRLDCFWVDTGEFGSSCQNAWYEWLMLPAEGEEENVKE